jgi:translation initiation factor IF-3
MRLRGRPIPPEPVSTQRINESIDAREVLLINADGHRRGVVSIEEALAAAQEAGLDLVEVAPDASPPVCRVCDHSKILYELRRKQREAKKHKRAQDIKEIKMKPRIGPHDYGIKMRHAKELLEAGHKVKMTVEIRGRRRINPQQIVSLYEKMVEEISQVAEVDFNTRQIGRSRSVLVSPPKSRPGEGGNSRDATPKS